MDESNAHASNLDCATLEESILIAVNNVENYLLQLVSKNFSNDFRQQLRSVSVCNHYHFLERAFWG